MAYIKKEQVLYHIEKLYDVLPLPDSCRHIIASLKAYIKGAPTEDIVEVKHGEWIKNVVEKDGIHRPTFICSECGKRRFVLADYNFCPNCGAKMDGRSDT